MKRLLPLIFMLMSCDEWDRGGLDGLCQRNGSCNPGLVCVADYPSWSKHRCTLAEKPIPDAGSR